MVSWPVGDHWLLPQSQSDRSAAAVWSRCWPGRIRMGKFRRPRVSGRWRNLRHWTREGHHHQGRTQFVSARSRGTCRARRGHSQGMHRRIRLDGRSHRHGEIGGRRGDSRTRCGAAFSARFYGHRSCVARIGAPTGSRGVNSSGQHPKNVQR